MWQNPQFPADLVTFTKRILSWKTSVFVQCSMVKCKYIGYNTQQINPLSASVALI